MTPQIKKDTSKGANQNQDDYIMTTIESQVWNRLSHKPISRNALRLRTGYSDRQIRKAVQNLRNNGYPVAIAIKMVTGLQEVKMKFTC